MKRILHVAASAWITLGILASGHAWPAEQWVGLAGGQARSDPAAGRSTQPPKVSVVRNEHAAFRVVADVDHPDRVYRVGDHLVIHVQSQRAGFLYIFYQQADGTAFCIFPNQYQRDHHIAAQIRTTVPPPQNATFALPIGPPYGEETILAVVAEEELDPTLFGAQSFVDANMTAVNPHRLIQTASGRLAVRQSSWAEHHVNIQVVAAGASQTPGKKRVGMFVGVDRYRDSRIPQLNACENDARQMLAAFQQHGSLATGVLLTNEDATLRKVQESFQRLVALTRPGDELILFWSGHGGQMDDDADEERDGKDEYLVPYDGSGSDRRGTMLGDDEFGRWLQDLDRRRVVVILDACHSGGASATTKDMEADFGFDFIGAEFAGTKDIGAHDAVLLCSSDSEQLSQILRKEPVSVFTYYFLQRFLLKPDAPITLEEVYDHVKREVPRYVEQNVPRRRTPQVPILVNTTGQKFYLRQ